MERAVSWYHARLLTSPDAGSARTYLRSRGYDGEVVRAFRLGWAPDAWDALARALALPDEVLEQTGLGMRNRRGRQQDRVRGRAVATCGTALADDHFRTLKNFARRVVLAYDADTAGQAAAERFYEWERRYELDIAVASLPAGADPGDLAARDPDALRAAVAGAQPFLSFPLERVLAQADLGSPEGRARAAERALPVIAEHPSDLVRDQYVMEVADRCRAAPERLRAGLADAIRAGKANKGPRHPAPASGSRPGRAEQADEAAQSGRKPRV